MDVAGQEDELVIDLTTDEGLVGELLLENGKTTTTDV